MRAADGAVEAVDLQSDGSLDWHTIGNKPPRGLCGSGLLDLAAALLEGGLIVPSGRLTDPEHFRMHYPHSPLAGRIVELAARRSFRLTEPTDAGLAGIFLTQADIRQVQVAKSAIVTGIKILLDETGLREQDIDQVLIAGAFGAYLRPVTLVRLGFFPQMWQDRIEFTGNTALSGASMALLSCDVREQMEQTASKIDYISLEDYPSFENLFIRNMRLG
jgi:uncharacterized 2Fe-2S/4Fe-4S cluster protein (DUF4445 family)